MRERLDKEARLSNQELAVNIHKKMLNRFGYHRDSDWEPTEYNIVVMDDDEFEDYIFSSPTDPELTIKQRVKFSRQTLAQANFDEGKLYIRRSIVNPQEKSLVLAHEMFHLWFKRDCLNPNDQYSYSVNETLVETLALEALGYFDLPKEDREPMVDNSINNSILIKGILDELGNKGWRELFKACQTGREKGIQTLLEDEFGKQPPAKLRRMNDKSAKIYDQSFWGRLKELALMIYLIRQDPNFQYQHRNEVIQLGRLIILWSNMDKRYLAGWINLF
jgi:hypothetical protein